MIVRYEMSNIRKYLRVSLSLGVTSAQRIETKKYGEVILRRDLRISEHHTTQFLLPIQFDPVPTLNPNNMNEACPG